MFCVITMTLCLQGFRWLGWNLVAMDVWVSVESTAFSEQGLQLSAIPLRTAQDYDRNPKIISAEGAFKISVLKAIKSSADY